MPRIHVLKKVTEVSRCARGECPSFDDGGNGSEAPTCFATERKYPFNIIGAEIKDEKIVAYWGLKTDFPDWCPLKVKQ